MKIHVRLLSGGSIELDDVNPEGTALHLKERIARRQSDDSAPIHRQRLIWRGREIKDQDLLSSCGINDGAIIHMVVRPMVAVEAAASQPSSADEQAAFTTVELAQTPQNLGSSRSTEQRARICKVFDLSTRVCMITVIDGVLLWMLILLFDPMWVPICIFVIMGYYGASSYSLWLLSAFAAFLIGLCTVSAYIFISETGMFAYFGIVSMAWHLLVLLQTQTLIFCITSLPAGDLALLRSVDAMPGSDAPSARQAAPRIWIPTLRRAAAPAA